MPENWEDSKLFFSSHDDSIEETIRPLSTCEIHNKNERPLSAEIPSGSSSVSQEKSMIPI